MQVNFTRTGIVDSFANKTNTKLNAVDAGENTAYLRYDSNNEIILDASSANSTDKFSYVVHYTTGGKAETHKVHTEQTVSAITSEKLTYESANTPDIGTSVQVEVTNEGTGEVFWSNTIVMKAKKV